MRFLRVLGRKISAGKESREVGALDPLGAPRVEPRWSLAAVDSLPSSSQNN